MVPSTGYAVERGPSIKRNVFPIPVLRQRETADGVVGRHHDLFRVAVLLGGGLRLDDPIALVDLLRNPGYKKYFVVIFQILRTHNKDAICVRTRGGPYGSPPPALVVCSEVAVPPLKGDASPHLPSS